MAKKNASDPLVIKWRSQELYTSQFLDFIFSTFFCFLLSPHKTAVRFYFPCSGRILVVQCDLVLRDRAAKTIVVLTFFQWPFECEKNAATTGSAILADNKAE